MMRTPMARSSWKSFAARAITGPQCSAAKGSVATEGSRWPRCMSTAMTAVEWACNLIPLPSSPQISSVENFWVDRGSGRRALESPRHLFGGFGLQLNHGLARIKGQVWSENYIRSLPQRMICRRWLNAEHIKGGAAQPVFLQRYRESLLVDDSTPRRVDEERGWLHPRQLALSDQIVCLWRKWHVNRNRISLSKEPFKVDGFRSKRSDRGGFEIRIIDEHLHSQRLYLRCKRFGDFAESKQPQRLAAKPANSRMSDDVPGSGFHGPIGANDLARERQE